MVESGVKFAIFHNIYAISCFALVDFTSNVDLDREKDCFLLLTFYFLGEGNVFSVLPNECDISPLSSSSFRVIFRPVSMRFVLQFTVTALLLVPIHAPKIHDCCLLNATYNH